MADTESALEGLYDDDEVEEPQPKSKQKASVEKTNSELVEKLIASANDPKPKRSHTRRSKEEQELDDLDEEKEDKVKKLENLKKLKEEYADKIMSGLDVLKEHPKIKDIGDAAKKGLEKYTLKELQAIWGKIMGLRGGGHPRHYLYPATIAALGFTETLLEPTDYKITGMAKKVADDKEFQIDFHMTCLHYFPHNHGGPETNLVIALFKHYAAATSGNGEDRQAERQWMATPAPETLVEEYSDL